MRPRRADRAAALTAACVLALGGCTSDEPDDVVRTSGPLAAGFEMEPGSGLIGTEFPSGDEGLHVFLRIEEDMEGVFDGYARQAAQLGFPVTPYLGRPDGQWCSDNPEKWDSYVGEDSPFEVECSASGSDIGESDSPPYWSLSMRGLAGPDGGGYLEISGGRFSGEAPAPRPPVDDGPVAPLTDAEVVSSDLAVYEDDPQLRMVEGSELVFDPLPSSCATGGWKAMLRVTGDLLPVMRGYAEQIDAMRAFNRAEVVGDEDQPSVFSSAAGGGDLYAVGVAGDPSYILLGRCND